MKEMKEIKQIKIMINKETPIYNQFNDSKLSEELANYIYEQFKGLPLKSNVTINIHSNYKMEENEKTNLIDEIREYFGLNVRENLLLLKFEYFKRIILLLFGSSLLTISHFLNAEYYYLVNSIFTIFGWVLIGEFLYSILFFNIKTRFENKRFKKIINAKINFEDSKNMNKCE